MSKVNFIIEELNSSGGIKIISEVMNTYADNDYFIDLYIVNNSKQFYILNENIRIIFLADSRVKFGVLSIYRTIQIIRSMNDPIFVTNFRISLLCSLFKRRSNKNLIYFLIQGMDRISLIRNASSNYFLRVINSVLYLASTLISAKRIYVSKYLRNSYNRSGIVIPNYCSEVFHDRNVINDFAKDIVIGIVSTSSPNKGFMLFRDIIDCIHQNDEFGGYNFIFKCATQDSILPRDYSNIVTFESPNNDVQMKDFYDSCNLILSLSISEGFNLPIIEAMAAGRVVLSTNDGASADIIENEVNGILIENRNAEVFANRILSLIHDKLSFYRISNNAIECSKRYSLNAFRNSYLNLLS